MSAICDGERTKNDVIQETVEEYKEVFMRTKQNFNVLINVSDMMVIQRKQ